MIDETKKNKEKMKKILRSNRRRGEECWSEFESLKSQDASF